MGIVAVGTVMSDTVIDMQKFISAIQNGTAVAIVFGCLSYFKMMMNVNNIHDWWDFPLLIIFGTIFYIFTKTLWKNFNKED